MADESKFPIPVKLVAQTGVKLTVNDGEDVALEVGDFLLISADQARLVAELVSSYRKFYERLVEREETQSTSVHYRDQLTEAQTTTERVAMSWNIPKES